MFFFFKFLGIFMKNYNSKFLKSFRIALKIVGYENINNDRNINFRNDHSRRDSNYLSEKKEKYKNEKKRGKENFAIFL